MLAIGLLRLGTFVKYIPYPVTVGFTAGIAVIIFSGELADLFGLTPHGKVPGPLVPKLVALFDAAPTVNVQAVAVAALSIGTIVAVRRWRPQWPAYLIGVVLAGVAAWAFGLQVETIASRFGGIPNTVPLPHWPDLTPDKVLECCRQRFRLRFLAASKASCRRSSPTA
jgi:sulfate permease, SulP family